MDFRKALVMAWECGGEIVANLGSPSSAHEKIGFDAVLGRETKENIVAAAGIEKWEDFTKSEQDALLFAYCKGWTSEVRAHKTF